VSRVQLFRRENLEGITMVRSSSKTHDVPGVADAEQGSVLLDGPDGVAVTMTPGAATATGESLIGAAKRAQAQAEAPEGEADMSEAGE
jgi:hypothetical protein